MTSWSSHRPELHRKRRGSYQDRDSYHILSENLATCGKYSNYTRGENLIGGVEELVNCRETIVREVVVVSQSV